MYGLNSKSIEVNIWGTYIQEKINVNQTKNYSVREDLGLNKETILFFLIGL